MRIIRIIALVAALGALLVGAVLAGDPDDPLKKPDAESAAAPAIQSPSGGKSDPAKAKPELAGILAKGEKAPKEEREQTTAAMRTVETQISEKAAVDGEQKLAERLAGEFGVTPQSILAEKAATNASWGNLLIAYTLAATGESGATPAELLSLQKDGAGWGQIAAGVGLPLGQALRGVQEESRVAMGLEKADGQVLRKLQEDLSARAPASGDSPETGHGSGSENAAKRAPKG